MERVPLQERGPHPKLGDKPDTAVARVPIARDLNSIVLLYDRIKDRLLGQTRWGMRGSSTRVSERELLFRRPGGTAIDGVDRQSLTTSVAPWLGPIASRQVTAGPTASAREPKTLPGTASWLHADKRSSKATGDDGEVARRGVRAGRWCDPGCSPSGRENSAARRCGRSDASSKQVSWCCARVIPDVAGPLRSRTVAGPIANPATSGAREALRKRVKQNGSASLPGTAPAAFVNRSPNV